MQKKNKRRGAAFVLLAALTSKRPMKSDKEREARVCEFKKKDNSKTSESTKPSNHKYYS